MIEIAPMIILPNFNADEFDCKCGCELNNMSSIFLWRLQQARTEAQIPFIINSGYRCEAHNKEVGRKSQGEHVFGEAADISTPNSHIRFKILEAAFKVGFRRIGLGPDFIHLGGKYNYPQQVLWLYP